jgi:hypothetical protein
LQIKICVSEYNNAEYGKVYEDVKQIRDEDVGDEEIKVKKEVLKREEIKLSRQLII